MNLLILRIFVSFLNSDITNKSVYQVNMIEETKDEQKNFLKRVEIKTMQKDIIRLREAETLSERERIASLKTAEEAKKEKLEQQKMKRDSGN